MYKSALLTRLDVLVNWVGWTQFESASLRFVCPHPPLFVIIHHLHSALTESCFHSCTWGNFPVGPDSNSSWATPFTDTQYTHRKGSFANAISAQLLFFSLQAKGRTLPVEGLHGPGTWERNSTGSPMLQSCDCSWRWHTVQQLNCDTLFYRGTSQFLSHWQWS